MAAFFTALTAGTGLFGAGAGAAAAGGTATAAVGAASTISQVLSAGSALAAIGQGIAANRMAKTQAGFQMVQAEQEKLAGAEGARDLAKEYADLRSEQDAIQLANGLDIGLGTPANVADATMRQADRNIAVTRRNADNRAAASRLRARGLLSEGRVALMSGFGKAGQIGLDSYQLTG